MRLDSRLRRLERVTKPSGVCVHLPWIVTGGFGQDNQQPDTRTCPCGRERGRIVIEYVDDWRSRSSDPTKPPIVKALRGVRMADL